jgi:response regulator of citrate/malate metabolism
MPSCLIIEDDTIFQTIFEKHMKKHPYLSGLHIYKASTYQEAINYFQDYNVEHELKFVFLDIMLDSGFTGWDVLSSAEFNNTEGSVPVFVCSSSNTNVDKLKSMTFDSVRGFFLKPTDMSILDLIHKEIS